ncbi:hypothetical protein U9M48_024344 [Paspalum notatum var. saurae]|uniref:Uncharacterized protein n=1 Tax=Paspalum notatum var. saurae TaxID=547442 RepID=A0AAQ3TNG3_PASNO
MTIRGFPAWPMRTGHVSAPGRFPPCKARFAAQCLHGPSGAWCASFLAMQPAGHQVTWDEHLAAFWAHYLLPSLIELKQREFRAL